MHRVTKIIDFCYGHRLLQHTGKCRHLHGHNGRAEVDVESAALDPMGMVVDFGDVREMVKGWIDKHIDHRMVLQRNDPAVKPLLDLAEPLYLVDEPPTAENIARLIYTEARRMGLMVSEVRVWETPSSTAAYRE